MEIKQIKLLLNLYSNSIFLLIITLYIKNLSQYFLFLFNINSKHLFKKIIWRIKIIIKYDKAYIRNISKGYHILITTRIDYDDQIYYDAVNDVRKAININKPI